MPVIAITREMASLGAEVANGLAEDLGLKLLEHELFTTTAGRPGIGKSLVSKFGMRKSRKLEQWDSSENPSYQYTAEDVFTAASQGNVVIRGWGGPYLLRAVSHVVRVRVCAPLEFRVQVLMERLGIDNPDVAREEIARSDAAHNRIISELFQVNYRSPLFYHLTINSEVVPAAAAVQMIKGLVELPAFQQSTESQNLLTEHLLMAKITKSLQIDNNTREDADSIRIDLEPGTGLVSISGVVTSEQHKQYAEQVVRSVSGVSGVTNNLAAMPRYAATGLLDR